MYEEEHWTDEIFDVSFDDDGPDIEGVLDIKVGSLIKRLLPKTMYGTAIFGMATVAYVANKTSGSSVTFYSSLVSISAMLSVVGIVVSAGIFNRRVYPRNGKAKDDEEKDAKGASQPDHEPRSQAAA